MTTKMILTVAE